MNRYIFNLSLLLALLAGDPARAAEADSTLNAVRVEFELIDRAGNTVTETDLHGKYVLLAFGFTHCLHICPIMAANMGMALNIAGPAAMGVFISVDTERDTPEVTNAYAAKFHDSMIGLGGSHEQIQAAAGNFGISYVVTKSQKAYTVEHTSDIFLIGPNGRLIDIFALNAPPKEIAAAMLEAQDH